MSSFLGINTNSFTEIIEPLDVLIVLKKMQEEKMTVPDVTLASCGAFWLLARTLFPGHEECEVGLYISIELTEEQTEELTDICDGKFICDYMGGGPIVIVEDHGITMDIYSDSNFYVHGLFEDMIELRDLLNSYRETNKNEESDLDEHDNQDND